MSEINIIGSGIIRSRIGGGFEPLGHIVVFFDMEKEKNRQLKQENESKSDLVFTLNNSKVNLVGAPTPFNNDFKKRFIVSAFTDIAQTLNKMDEYHRIVKKIIQRITSLNQYHSWGSFK